MKQLPGGLEIGNRRRKNRTVGRDCLPVGEVQEHEVRTREAIVNLGDLFGVYHNIKE